MSTIQERLRQLELRLAELERERSSMRERLAAQRHKPRGLTHWRALGGLGLAVILVGIGLLAAPTSEAKVKAPAAHSVQAPFHVLDKAGKVILSVEDAGERGISVLDKGGKRLVFVGGSVKGNGMVETYGTNPEGGCILGGSGGLAVSSGDIAVYKDKKKLSELGPQGLKIYDKSEQPVALLLSQEDSYGGLALKKGGKTLVELQAEDEVGQLYVRGSDGSMRVSLTEYGVRAHDKSGGAIARMGEETGGGGFIGVGKDKKIYAGLFTISDAGVVAVRGPDDKAVVELGKKGVQVYNNGTSVGMLGFSPSGSGAGYLSLSNPGGTTVVEGGMLPDKRGIMRAYPFKPRAGDILVGQNLIIGANE